MGDFVKFCLYPAPTDNAGQLLSAITDLIQKHGAGYIWDKGGVSMRVSSSPQLGDYLTGSLELGDNMEDEWFLLSLLFEISGSYHSLVVQVEDMDGQFMLIEAAEDLPDWLEPETSENRVFVCRGKVCIIPIEASQSPKLSEAVKYVREDPFRSYASPAIQMTIQSRIAMFSRGFDQFHHKSKVLVPLSIAAVIKLEPYLLPKAINMFCSGDSRPTLSLSQYSGEPFVETLITFSRLHFAKLLFQQYHPPKGYKQMNQSDPQYTRFDLGLKITAGLELLRSKEETPKLTMKKIKEQVDVSNPEAYVTIGQEGDLKWMEIDPNTLEEDFEASQKALQMDDMEISELMDQWNKEFDDPSVAKDEKFLSKSVKGLKEFMERMSLYEGVDVEEGLRDQDESDKDEDHSDQASEKDESDQSEPEDDENFIEFEILETLRHDPDLLMRIVEMNAHAGVDNTDLMTKLQRLVEPDQTTGMPKKGLADIDPAKVAEARMKPERNLPDAIDQQNAEKAENDEKEGFEDDATDDSADDMVSDFSSSDEDYGDVAEHTPTLKELFKTAPAKEVTLDELESTSDPEPTSDSESSSDCRAEPSIREYFDQMDAELAGKLKCSEFTGVAKESNLAGNLDQADLDYNLAKSLVDIRQMQDEAGAAGPSSTLLASLRNPKK